MINDLIKLIEERDRYRAALQKIVDGKEVMMPGGYTETQSWEDESEIIADEALNPRVSGHKPDCDYHLDQYNFECTCGAIPKSNILREVFDALDAIVREKQPPSPVDDPRYAHQLAEAKARVANVNQDGTPRRYAVAETPSKVRVEEARELDIEATAENIARHLSDYKGSGRFHGPAYGAAKAGALMGLCAALPTQTPEPVAPTGDGEIDRLRAAMTEVLRPFRGELKQAANNETIVRWCHVQSIDAALTALAPKEEKTDE